MMLFFLLGLNMGQSKCEATGGPTENEFFMQREAESRNEDRQIPDDII